METVLGRLQPLEAKLAGLEQGLRSATRGPVRPLRGAAGGGAGTGGGSGRGENPFAEISQQLTRLYGQKDVAVETVLGRLAPLEAKLAELERGWRSATRAACSTASRSGWRRCRDGWRLWKAENPFAEIREQLTRLYGQKDAAVETMLGRLAPLEAKLAELDGGLARLAPLAEERAVVEGLRARIEALHWAQGEVAAGLAALRGGGAWASPGSYARIEAQADRLAPLEARLAAIEAREPDGIRALAARLAAEQARCGAARLAAGLRPTEAPAAGSGRAEPAAATAELEAIWALPRIVSLHQK